MAAPNKPEWYGSGKDVPCRTGLAREGGVSVDTIVSDTPLSRASPLPQVACHTRHRVCNPLLSRAVLAWRLKPVGSFTWQTPPASTGRQLKVTRHRRRCW